MVVTVKSYAMTFTSFPVDLMRSVVLKVPTILPILQLLVPTSTMVPYALITSAPPITEYCCKISPLVKVAV